MSIFSVLLFLVVLGFVLWLVNTYVPMQPIVKTIINFILVIILILWLLQAFGLIPMHNLHMNVC
jgi:hypothetical protein